MSASGFSLKKAIIKPLRDDPTQLLERFLVGPQAIHDQAEAAILSLPDQIKPETVRQDLLQYLMPLVGFTSELRSITDRLTTAQLRRLVKVAVPLWNQRHTESGLINAIRLLTGRAAVLSDWFTYRAMLGETSLLNDQLTSGGDFWVIGGSISTYDEYWSNIRLMDDGTLDELLLLDVCKLMRPLDERFEIFIDDFLDTFDGALDKWVNASGGSLSSAAVIDTGTDAGTMKLLANGQVKPTIPILPNSTDHHDYNIAFKFKMPTAANLVVRFYADSGVPHAGTAYELSISTNFSPGIASFSRYNAGVQTPLQPAGNWPSLNIAPDTWYSCRIIITNLTSTSRSIRIYVDGIQVVPGTQGGTELIDTGAASPSSGPYYFSTPSGAYIHLDNVESWRNPARFATIGLSTITERGGAVTMTSNFIQ